MMQGGQGSQNNRAIQVAVNAGLQTYQLSEKQAIVEGATCESGVGNLFTISSGLLRVAARLLTLQEPRAILPKLSENPKILAKWALFSNPKP